MRRDSNPFAELYLGESITHDHFVQLFSPYLVPHVLSLYQRSNIVLKGSQGNGKSMLLHLLKPEVRVAYEQSKTEWPLPEDSSKFISAGINIMRSPAIDFGQRSLDSNLDATLAPLFFADFLNYWLAADLLKSVRVMHEAVQSGYNMPVRPNWTQNKLDAMTQSLKKAASWGGGLEEVGTYSDLKEVLQTRLSIYSRFLNFNEMVLPPNFYQTKTVTGQALSALARRLIEYDILPEDTYFLIRIDQCDDILREAPSTEHGTTIFRGFREVINKLLGLRDDMVFYRVASRPYAWERHTRIFGTVSPVEQLRNYGVIDIDEVLRKKENSPEWTFAQYGEDIFRRRLRLYDYEVPSEERAGILVFGRSPKPALKAIGYARSADNIVREEGLQKDVFEFLSNLAKTSPLEAKLGEAWVRQRVGKPEAAIEVVRSLPWTNVKQRYWRKERIGQALLQIAARRAQRLKWWGWNDVLELSGVNVLALLSISQMTWECWIKYGRAEPDGKAGTLPPLISPESQAEGIQLASTAWHRKLSGEPGSDALMPFANELGRLLRRRLRDDETMSYPGANGISVVESELQYARNVDAILKEAHDYGVIISYYHQSKDSSAKVRRKCYLNPILSPYYQLPVAHTKEPLYLTVEKLRQILVTCRVLAGEIGSRGSSARASLPPHPGLFDEEKST